MKVFLFIMIFSEYTIRHKLLIEITVKTLPFLRLSLTLLIVAGWASFTCHHRCCSSLHNNWIKLDAVDCGGLG